VAMAVAAAGELDVYVVGRGHGLPLRISTGGDDFWPSWSADGKRVIWNSGRDGDPQLYWRAADASDEEERLTTGPGYKRRCSFAPNGQAVAFTAPAGFVSASRDGQAATNSLKGSDDIWVLPLSGDRVPYPLISTRYNEQESQFSPDGKMIAYQSDETGANEIWIQPIVIEGPLVRKAGTSRQVTLSGGQGPRWASSSRELFYRDTRSFYTVPSESVASFQPGAPRRMFDGEFEEGWEVEKDGPNFVMLQNGPGYPRLNAYRYVAHWVDDVRRRLGTRARP
jgi:eukaryotic-like serine/threonine-protein kinase